MDKKSNVKTDFSLTEEELDKIMEEVRISENSPPFEDLALKQFVKEPSESDLCNNFKLKPWQFTLLTFLLLIMLLVSILSGSNGGMEIYVAIPIAFLSFLGFLILMICAKEHDEENNKRYK